MIIVAGWGRTGTSIMFRCLQESDFYGGKPEELGGHEAKTEHLAFRSLNYRFAIRNPAPIIHQSLFLEYLERRGVNLLKDPQLAVCIRTWLEKSHIFREAKYIWCRRDQLEAAKSMVRLKIPRFPDMRGILTTRAALQTCKCHEKVWGEVLQDLDHCVVWLEDLLHHTATTAKFVSEFIGREFDTSLISVKETYAG